jgi:hypothetical protein
VEKCPICTMPAALGPYHGGLFHFNCLCCGEFKMTTEADAFLKADPIDGIHVNAASGYIRRNENLTIDSKDLESLRNSRIPTVGEKAARLLLAFADEYPVPGTIFPDPFPRVVMTLNRLAQYTAETVYPEDAITEYASFLKWLAIASANDANELNWLVREVLAENNFVEFTKQMESFENRGISRLILTARGWGEIERIRNVNRESATAFVAMSFRPEFVPLYDQGIAPGIAAAGFEPIRVDRKEYNDKIDDEIVASIKKSRFLVADFSVDRGGIYFEAGYALGFGIPVIWLVRQAEKDAIHFDNRQYNFIRWEPNDYAVLAKALRNRIEATIGHGPVRGS